MVPSLEEEATLQLSQLTAKSVISPSWPRAVMRSRPVSKSQNCKLYSSDVHEGDVG